MAMVEQAPKMDTTQGSGHQSRAKGRPSGVGGLAARPLADAEHCSEVASEEENILRAAN
jgi:hypothetical protein